MNIGKAIKISRNQKGITQSQLSEISGLSVSYISLIEKGKRDPSFSTIEKISEALKIPLSIIMFLGADENEFKALKPELVEKLSYTTLQLIKFSVDDDVEV